jgi:phage nucleotide-binding protein
MSLKITKTGELASRRIAMLIVGPSGVGKTSLIKTFPEPSSQTLMISFEGGTACLAGTDFDVIESDNSKPIEFMEEVYNALCSDEYKKKYKNIFIDSLTEMGQVVLAQLKKDPHYGQSKNALQMYGKYNDIMTMIIKSFRDMSDYNVVFTCLDAVEKDGLEKIESVNIPGSGVKNGIRAWFDIVVFYKIFKDEEGNVYRKLITSPEESPLAKDRTSKLEQFEDADLSAIINKIIKE